MTDEPLLRMTGIAKRFGDVQANAGVDLTVRPGEIHALLGENGSGKSTLVRILCGVTQADAGRIFWRGEPVEVKTPVQARALGIGVVFQHFSLFAALSVVDNIALGLQPSQCVGLADRIAAVAGEYGFALEAHRPIYSLSVGERQRVEIIRCLLTEPQLLVLDEPTSVLTPQEAELLFVTLRRLAGEGCSVLYISHRLAELKSLCSNATVLRAGKVVGSCDPGVESSEHLAQMMIGHRPMVPEHQGEEPAEHAVRLKVAGLELPAQDIHEVALDGIELEVKAGEIVGIAGIAGNGQTELGAALAGESPVAAGMLHFDDQPVGDLSPGQRRALGMLYVPEKRHGHAAVSALPLWENLCLTARHTSGLISNGMLKPALAEKACARLIDEYDVRCDGPRSVAGSLSGGNLQKFIVGREISQRPQVLIVMQPTWGVDAGAAAAIHQALIDLADAGTAVLVISQDLDEIFVLADRIAVISAGHLSPAQQAGQMTAERIGMLMGGTHAGDGRHAA